MALGKKSSILMVLSFLTLIPLSLGGNGCTPSVLDNCNTALADGCDLTTNQRFPSTTSLQFPKGIDICADNIYLNCHGGSISGSGQTSGVGISINSRSNVIIKNCVINSFQRGIELSDAKGIALIENTISGNREGIVLTGASLNGSSENIVAKNQLFTNSQNALSIINADHNWFENNIISNNGWQGTGNPGAIYIRDASNNILIRNDISRNQDDGVYLTGSNNNQMSKNRIANNSQNGISLMQPNQGTLISKNDILSNMQSGIIAAYDTNTRVDSNRVNKNKLTGISLSWSNNAVVKGNTVQSNLMEGITLYQSSGALLNENMLEKNAGGVKMTSSSGNTLAENSFLQNTQQSWDNGANSWDMGLPTGGNLWSDYTHASQGCFDSDSDGFCDDPYSVLGGLNVDHYPVASP